MNAQAELNLHWPPMEEGMFSDVAAHKFFFFNQKSSDFLLLLLHKNMHEEYSFEAILMNTHNICFVETQEKYFS